MAAYYNEFDPQVAAWLRELIKRGLIADGVVDERSIKEVQPSDLKGFTQVHLFAGIGGWSYALRLAGVSDDFPVWTGSCPCQPFSEAGKGKGQADERHLWPEMFRLIRECRPERVFGEQVEGAVKHGWLDGVSADLEAEGYSVGSCVLGAHSLSAPHRRHRLYWVAESQSWRQRSDRQEVQGQDRGRGGTRNLGLAYGAGLPVLQSDAVSGALEIQARRTATESSIPFWADGVPTPCRDGKSRRAPPSVPLLAHGVPARVVRLRGYGNAIVPAVAAEFIQAYFDISST